MTSARERPFGPRKIEKLEVDTPVSTQRARAEGYAEGFRAGAEAQPDRELYAFVEVPWSSIRAEDTIMGEDGGMYHVVRSGRMPVSGGASVDGLPEPGWIVTLVCGTYRDVTCLDHDTRVSVLVPVALADALTVAHAGLPGSRLIATRPDPGGQFEGDLPWRVALGTDGLPRPAG
jgi:hypothetical protein